MSEIQPGLVPKVVVCPRINAGCIATAGSCFGPAEVRELNKDGKVLHREQFCTKGYTKNLTLPPIRGGGHPESLQGRLPSHVNVLNSALEEYGANAEFDEGVVFVEAVPVNPVRSSNVEASFIILD